MQIIYNLRFPGQYYMPETGLFYNYFRDYDPQTGRYIESDPIGLGGGINTYAYVGNSPLKAIDPFGLMSICRMGSSYFDCGAEPPSAVGSCEQAMMAGPYITGWMPCSTAPPPSTNCGSSSNDPVDDPFGPLGFVCAVLPRFARINQRRLSRALSAPARTPRAPPCA